jgi:predicted HicB family RNase H-like nuclease
MYTLCPRAIRTFRIDRIPARKPGTLMLRIRPKVHAAAAIARPRPASSKS